MIDRLAMVLSELLGFLGMAFWSIVLGASAIIWIIAIWGLAYLAILSAGAAP